MSEWRKQAILLIDDLIARHNIKSVFEVGCDDAGISRSLAKQYPEIHFDGIDYREEKIKEAKQLQVEHGLKNCNFDFDYFLDIKEIKKQYDVVIFTEVFEHLVAENQIYSLRLLGNLMSDKGFIVFTCPNGDYLLSYLETQKTFSGRYGKDFFDNMYQTEHWLEPTHKEIKKIFVSLGFDILVSGYFNLPKRRYLFIEKLESFLNKIPMVSNGIFKSQFIVAQKNANSILLKRLSLYG